jgi:hypothetical protein
MSSSFLRPPTAVEFRHHFALFMLTSVSAVLQHWLWNPVSGERFSPGNVGPYTLLLTYRRTVASKTD